MIFYKTIVPLRNKLGHFRDQGKTIGFVPTMGALHNGHLSLIEQCRRETDITVCSIFVNPTQFNDKKDFEKYPVTIEKDILLLEKSGTDILFNPAVDEIYPMGFNSNQQFHLGYLENILEGFYRPGHFRGVCQVIYRMLEIVEPVKMFLGQKDYQQCMVLKKMVSDLEINTSIIVSATLREEDGLAMSSRNLRLDKVAREHAPAIFKALTYIKENIEVFEFTQLKQNAEAFILNNGFEKVDYVEICNAETLEPASAFQKDTPLIVLAAAFINGVRLIDNLLIQ